MISWDGTDWGFASWNQDHNLRTAMKNSVVWFFLELARRIGTERMQKYVNLLEYVLKRILDDSTGDISNPSKRLWPIRAENYRDADRILNSKNIILNQEPDEQSKSTPPDQVLDLLSLVMVEEKLPDLETIKSWSRIMIGRAVDWAVYTHLEASDNNIMVPPKPDFL